MASDVMALFRTTARSSHSWALQAWLTGSPTGIFLRSRVLRRGPSLLLSVCRASSISS